MGCERSKEVDRYDSARHGVMQELIPLMKDWRHAYQFYLDNDRPPVAFAQAKARRKLVFARWRRAHSQLEHDGHVLFHISGSWKLIDPSDSTTHCEGDDPTQAPFSLSHPITARNSKNYCPFFSRF